MKLIDASRRYYKGNTHAHTTRSDGTQSPENVMRMFRDAGYDFLVLSDHWTPGPTEEFEGMLVLTGAEYDFNFPEQVLHIVGVFPDEAATRGFHHRMDYPELIERFSMRVAAGWRCSPRHMQAVLRMRCAGKALPGCCGRARSTAWCCLAPLRGAYGGFTTV